MTTLTTFACAAGLAAALLGAPSQAQTPERRYTPMEAFALAAGSPFPLDALTTPDGRRLAAEALRGQPVLVNFFTRFCAPCIKEVPKLNQVQARHPELRVLAITPDSLPDAGRYIQQYGLNWPVAANAGDVMARQLHVSAFPSFALLDAQGRLITTVLAKQLGGEDGHATVEGIEAWVAAHLPRPAP